MKRNMLCLLTVVALAPLVAMSASALAPPAHRVGVVSVGYNVAKIAITPQFTRAPEHFIPPASWIMDLGDDTLSPVYPAVSATLPTKCASPVDALDTGQYFADGSHANYYYGKMDDPWRAFAVDEGFATADDIPAAALSG